MRHRVSLSCLLAAALAVISPGLAKAVPIVSVDTDPSTAGVQTSLEVNPGDMFSVDIVISGVEASSTLNAFELDLGFDPAILMATGVVDGGFLLAPSIVVQIDLTPPEVMFAEATLLPIGAVGSGVLASIGFTALTAGVSLLGLNDVVLSAPFGVPIAVDAVNDGSVTVRSAQEPSTVALFVVGLLTLAGIRRRDRRCPRGRKTQRSTGRRTEHPG